jgi:hypothetical protein
MCVGVAGDDQWLTSWLGKSGVLKRGDLSVGYRYCAGNARYCFTRNPIVTHESVDASGFEKP